MKYNQANRAPIAGCRAPLICTRLLPPLPPFFLTVAVRSMNKLKKFPSVAMICVDCGEHFSLICDVFFFNLTWCDI